ncbi:MAG: hypothetical protein QOF20_1808 [Acidimicrobiaceae bacterium]|nr:hypothetical protein [Acidimicrobiaceae bacterium]
MGFLDRAKKLAGQAKDAADQAKKLAEQATSKASDALSDASSRMAQSSGTTSAPPTAPGGGAPGGGGGATGGGGSGGGAPEYGTPYVPGMLGRPGWRERGLTDPAALLPIRERDHAGVPHTTKSKIIEEPFGMGRRWTSAGRSAALFYQLYPEHKAWEPPGGRAPFSGVAGASMATLNDGRTLVFLGAGGQSVVLELTGIDDPVRADLARTVAERLGAS